MCDKLVYGTTVFDDAMVYATIAYGTLVHATTGSATLVHVQAHRPARLVLSVLAS